MEAGFVALVILTAIICTMVGIHIGKKKAIRRDVQGVLNVDCGDPEGSPYLFLQLEVSIEDIVNRKQATFDVHVIK
jgi:hypothetical protein